MSTLDVVTQVGGTAANFLDIGGGANADVMAAALEVINSDRNVRAIFVNIFGGITRVDEVANGILEALSRVDITAPIALRLDGTNAEEGREILAPHLSPTLVAEQTMLDGARRAVALAGELGMSIFVDENDDGPGPGPDRWSGTLPRTSQQGLRHEGGRRGDTRQGRHRRRRHTGVRHRRRGCREDRCRGVVRRRPAEVRGRSDHGGSRGGVSASSSASPRASRLTTRLSSTTSSSATIPGTRLLGPELPGDHLAGKVQHRDHLRRHRPRRAARSGS